MDDYLTASLPGGYDCVASALSIHHLPDPQKRLYFSHWNTAQCEWVASGFDPAVRRANPRGEQ